MDDTPIEIQRLALISHKLETLEAEKKRLEAERIKFIVDCRAINIPLATIGAVAGLSRQRITQIIDKELITDNAFRNDALIPKEESESYRREGEGLTPEELKAILASTPVEPLD